MSSLYAAIISILESTYAAPFKAPDTSARFRKQTNISSSHHHEAFHQFTDRRKASMTPQAISEFLEAVCRMLLKDAPDIKISFAKPSDPKRFSDFPDIEDVNNKQCSCLIKFEKNGKTLTEECLGEFRNPMSASFLGKNRMMGEQFSGIADSVEEVLNRLR